MAAMLWVNSVCMYLFACQLRTPIRLDDAFLEELETLIALLARHISEVWNAEHKRDIMKVQK